MSKHIIDPGPRMSKAVVANGFVFVSGQVDGTGKTVTEQTQTILASIDAFLNRAGTNRSHLVSASIWLADIAATFAEMNAVWEAWIDPESPPARATVEAKLSSPAYLVEIAAVAVLPEG